jgi:hypothetical protein
MYVTAISVAPRRRSPGSCGRKCPRPVAFKRAISDAHRADLGGRGFSGARTGDNPRMYIGGGVLVLILIILLVLFLVRR